MNTKKIMGMTIVLLVLFPSLFFSACSELTPGLTPSAWTIVERGPTWNKCQQSGTNNYRLESYGKIINYKDDDGFYKPINTTLTTISNTDYILNSVPYRFLFDRTLGLITIYPDRNNLSRYVLMYLPQSFTIGNKPFYNFVPSLSQTSNSIIQWSTTNFNIQIRLERTGFYFEYIMKNSLSATTGYNMTVIPVGMGFDDIGFINVVSGANGVVKPIVVSYDENTHNMVLSFDINGLTYPITVDPSLVFYSGDQDCYIRGDSNIDYDIQWSAASGTLVNTSDSYVGQRLSSGLYRTYRSYEFFDTSGLPDDCVVTGGSLYLYFYTLTSMGDYLVLQNGMPSHPENPPVAGDYDKSFYSGDGGSLYVSALSTNYHPVVLNDTGISWVNKTSYTNLCLRSYKDIIGTPPTGDARCLFYSSEGLSPPYLSIDYTFDINTSVDAITPYNQTMNPLPLTASGASGIDNVTLYYRYSEDNLTWNMSYENYTIGQDTYTVFGFPLLIGSNLQTFTIGNTSMNNTFLLRNVSVYARKVASPTSFKTYIYAMDPVTGYPDMSAYLAVSDAFPASSMSTSFTWCNTTYSTNIYLQAGVTYAIGFSATTGARANKIHIGYDNLSSTYPGGMRYYEDGIGGWDEYPQDDYLFNLSGDWIQWNSTSNPDVVYPWNWSFTYPYNNGYYEFYSVGWYEDAGETHANVADAICNYTKFPFWLYLGSHVFSIPMLMSFGLLFVVTGFLLFYMRRKKRNWV